MQIAFMEPHERLKDARIAAGYLEASEAARALGIPEPTYLAHENGSRGFRAKADTYARKYKVSLEWLLTGRGPRGRREVSSTDSLDELEDHPSPRRSPPIIGEVAAGHWLEIDAVDEPKHDEACTIPLDPRFPEKAQYGLVVRGTSINKVAGPGEVLHCVDLGISGLEPQQEDLVIIERRRAQAGQKEVTAKRYRTKGRVVELSPESDDKRWATPLLLDPNKAKEDEEVAIIAIVVGVYKPLRLRR